MEIKAATKDHCLALAELALMAGDGIPGYFWADSQQPGQTIEQTGAELVASETANFSYRNIEVALIDNNVAGMLLAYRLPAATENDEIVEDFPEFVQPLVELEQCVPESFYINMLAAYPQYRGQGAGSALITAAENRAVTAGCDQITLEVFGSNIGALKLYQRLGYEQIERRPMIASDFHPAGEVLLLAKNLPR